MRGGNSNVFWLSIEKPFKQRNRYDIFIEYNIMNQLPYESFNNSYLFGIYFHYAQNFSKMFTRSSDSVSRIFEIFEI